MRRPLPIACSPACAPAPMGMFPGREVSEGGGTTSDFFMSSCCFLFPLLASSYDKLSLVHISHTYVLFLASFVLITL
jgi:hypothetical protein